MYSPDNKHIIVNYHYVEDPSPKFSGAFPCSVAEFDKQIKFLSENYKIGSVPEVFGAAKNNSQEKICAIAFDDGLKDQYQNALPILKKHNAFGIFFPITSTLECRLPVAHKVHLLLSRVPIEQMIDVFNDYLAEFYPDLKAQYFIPKDTRLTNKRLHETPAAANFKETLIRIPEDIKARFLRWCFSKFKLNEKKISSHLFMSREEIRDLKKQGMMVGNHSHSHYAFDVINEDVMRSEIKLSNKVLGEILGEVPTIFSYPHGRNNQASNRVLKEAGFQYALTIETREIKSQDDPLLLPRYDTNDIKNFYA